MDIEDIPYVVIENNTFLDIQNIGVLFSTKNSGLTKNGILKNNIFMNVGTASYVLHDESNQAAYNLIYSAGSTPSIATDIQDKEPLFVNSADIIGPDGLPFTEDDGLHMPIQTPGCGTGESGSVIGAYELCKPKGLRELK
jgi:hypothetical protein